MASTSVVVYICPVRKAVLSQQVPLGGLAIKLLKSVLQAERTVATQTANAQSSALKTGRADEWHKFSMLTEKKRKVCSKELHMQRCKSGDDKLKLGMCLPCVLCFHLHAEHITENLLSWAASGSKSVGSVNPCAW